MQYRVQDRCHDSIIMVAHQRWSSSAPAVVAVLAAEGGGVVAGNDDGKLFY